jgi:putative two-component system response regulator
MSNNSQGFNNNGISHVRAEIDALFEAIKLRDSDTADHCVAMAHYSYWISVEFDYANRNQYYAAGLVHDIGKLGMMDSILKGSQRLSEGDLPHIHAHVSDGVRVLKNLGIGGIILDLTQYHHERYDSSGYCEGLLGTNIPLAGRIGAIADVYTTLIGGRKYVAAKTPEQAIAIMYKERRFFDPEILEWFIQNVTREPSHLRVVGTRIEKMSWDYLSKIS